MSIFSKLLGKKTAEGADETVRVGGMEDFMTSNGGSAGYQ